jgi:hypothetical protein
MDCCISGNKLDFCSGRFKHRSLLIIYSGSLRWGVDNLGNFLRRLCLPKAINDWSLRSLQVKLIKMGGRIVRHARQIIFQLAEVAVPRDLFAAILERITRLCLSPG